MAYSDRIDSNHSDANFQRQTQTVIELFRVFAIYIEIPGIFIPSFWIYSEFLVAISSRIWHLLEVSGIYSKFLMPFSPLNSI